MLYQPLWRWRIILFWGVKVGYQVVDEKLIAGLKHVLQATDAPNHVVGIPYYVKM